MSPSSKKTASINEATKTQRTPLRRRIVFLSIPYLFVALMIFGIEGATRIFWPHIPALDVLIDSPSLRSDLAENKDSPLFIADPLLFWRVRPNLKDVYWDFTVISTNAQGLREDHDLDRKPPGGFRIVCLGDSVTFGFRVPMAFPGKPHDFDHSLFPYPGLCEKRLQAANANRRIEVIPLAAPAYATYQALNWLKRDIDFLKPDVVTACFGWNDVCLRPVPDRQSMPVDFAHVISRALLVHSQAVTHFAKWRGSKQSKGYSSAGPPVARISLEDYVANLLKISELARGHNAHAVLIGPVYRDSHSNPEEAARVRQYRDALRTAAQAHGIAYLEIGALTETNYPANDKLFGELVHPNAAGHQIMARELLKFLAAHQMLDSLQLPETLSDVSAH